MVYRHPLAFLPGLEGVALLHELPAADQPADLVVCALALVHVPDLGPVLAEFARVLRPGGQLVVSDIHLISQYLGDVPTVAGPDGQTGVLATYRHAVGDYVTAALGAGFAVRGCAEPRWPASDQAGGPLARQWCGPAADAAYTGTPAAIVWHFQRSGRCCGR